MTNDDSMPRTASPSLLRWVLVGVPCYGSWLAVNLLLVVLFPLYMMIELLGGRPGRRLLRRVCIGLLRWFFLFHLPLVGVYRVEKSPDMAMLKQLGSCLVVCNHTSWLDALIVFSLIPNVRILVSAKYQNVPLVKYPMRWLECIFVDRRSRDSIVSSLEAIRSAVESSAPVAVFPEGTRSRMGRIKPFRDIFFRIAIDTGTPVRPLLLTMDEPFLGPGAENFLTPRKATLRIRLLDATLPEPGERAGDMAFRVQRQFKRALRDMSHERGADGKDTLRD